jgi:hypothetical protein
MSEEQQQMNISERKKFGGCLLPLSSDFFPPLLTFYQKPQRLKFTKPYFINFLYVWEIQFVTLKLSILGDSSHLTNWIFCHELGQLSQYSDRIRGQMTKI